MTEEIERDPYTGFPIDKDGEVADFDSDFELASASFGLSVTERLFDKIA